MTAQQMEYEFLITYESIASAAAPGYTSREISILLTQAQEDIVKEVCNDGIDKNDFNRNVVKTLKRHISVNLNTLPNSSTPLPGKEYDLNVLVGANKFFYPHTEILMFNSSYRGKIIPMDLDAYTNLNNPFKKPTATKFWRIYKDTKMLFIHPTGLPLSNHFASITYIAKPTPIITATLLLEEAIEGVTAITNSCLDELVHRDIVYKAAKKAYAAVKDQLGYQIQTNEENS